MSSVKRDGRFSLCCSINKAKGLLVVALMTAPANLDETLWPAVNKRSNPGAKVAGVSLVQRKNTQLCKTLRRKCVAKSGLDFHYFLIYSSNKNMQIPVDLSETVGWSCLSRNSSMYTIYTMVVCVFIQRGFISSSLTGYFPDHLKNQSCRDTRLCK